MTVEGLGVVDDVVKQPVVSIVDSLYGLSGLTCAPTVEVVGAQIVGHIVVVQTVGQSLYPGNADEGIDGGVDLVVLLHVVGLICEERVDVQASVGVDNPVAFFVLGAHYRRHPGKACHGGSLSRVVIEREHSVGADLEPGVQGHIHIGPEGCPGVVISLYDT